MKAYEILFQIQWVSGPYNDIICKYRDFDEFHNIQYLYGDNGYTYQIWLDNHIILKFLKMYPLYL